MNEYWVTQIVPLFMITFSHSDYIERLELNGGLYSLYFLNYQNKNSGNQCIVITLMFILTDSLSKGFRSMAGCFICELYRTLLCAVISDLFTNSELYNFYCILYFFDIEFDFGTKNLKLV